MLRFSSYLLLLMLFLTACTSNNKNEQKIGEDGFPEFSQEQLQEMIKNQPQAQMQIPVQESTAQMILKMEEFLAKSPQDISTNYNLAKLYYQQYMKDNLSTTCQKAISFYTTVIDLQVDYEEGRPYYNRMLCYIDSKNYDAALNDLDHFIKINQDRTPVNYQSMQAEILFQKGNKEEACTAYQTAFSRYQKDSLPIHNEALWKDRCNN